MSSLKVNLRKAELSDMDSIYRWRNNPAVREYFFDSTAIDFQDHKAWYRKALNTDSKVLLLASNQERRVGVVRFDISQDEATLSIFVDPSLFGQGFGTAILQESVNWLKENKTGIKNIRAEILPENIGSIRAFEKSGFKKRYLVYEYKL